MSFRKYESYKDSGVEWIEEIPDYWQTMPLCRIAKLVTGITPPTSDQNNYADESEFPWVRPEDLLEAGTPTVASKFLSAKGWTFVRSVQANASLVCCIGTIGKVGFVDHAVATNQQITAVQFHSSYRYFYFALTAARAELEVASTGNVLRILNSERLGAVVMPVPPEVEANAIATFLDRETAKIDALIEEQKRLIELLKEKRQAVISHAVTKGLDPNAPVKDSGVEWLGEIPAHWNSHRIGKLCRKIGSGKTPLGGAEVYLDDGVLFIRSQNVHDEGLRLIDAVYLSEDIDADMSATRLLPGDILLNITGASLGRTCIVPDNIVKANVNQHVCIVRLIERKFRLFVSQAMKAISVKAQIAASQNGAARDGLNFDQVGRLQIALPPMIEMLDVVDCVERETRAIDALVAEAEGAANLLQERRSALISAAVTGKIDVRDRAHQQIAAE